jgi:hypothetical protein
VQRHYEESDVEGLRGVRIRILFSKGEEITEDGVRRLIEDLKLAVAHHETMVVIEADTHVAQRIRATSVVLAFERQIERHQATPMIVRELLDENGFRQQDLGELLGRKKDRQVVVSGWLLGRLPLSRRMIRRLRCLIEEGSLKSPAYVLDLLRVLDQSSQAENEMGDHED